MNTRLTISVVEGPFCRRHRDDQLTVVFLTHRRLAAPETNTHHHYSIQPPTRIWILSTSEERGITLLFHLDFIFSLLFLSFWDSTSNFYNSSRACDLLFFPPVLKDVEGVRQRRPLAGITLSCLALSAAALKTPSEDYFVQAVTAERYKSLVLSTINPVVQDSCCVENCTLR